MPLIDVRLYEGRLDEHTAPGLIAKLTDAVVEVFGPEMRASTWVVLGEIPRAHWGIAGEPGATPTPAARGPIAEGTA